MSQVLQKSRRKHLKKITSSAARHTNEDVVDANTSFVPHEMSAIRVRFSPAQQGQFSPVEWDDADEEIFDV